MNEFRIGFLYQRYRLSILLGFILIVLIICTNLSAVFWGDSITIWKPFSIVFSNTLPYLPLAFGASYVISCGEIDLSITGLIAFSGMTILLLQSINFPPIIGYLLILLIMLSIGILNGMLVSRFKVPSLIITLGVSFLFNGLAYLFNTILQNANQSSTLSSNYILPIFKNSLLLDIVIFIILVIVQKTLYWKKHLAVGLNEESSILLGLPFTKIKIIAFSISAVFCYLSTMLLISDFNLGGWSIGSQKGILLITIAVSVVGGTRITGGYFQPINVTLAYILWESLKHLATVLKIVSSETFEIALGIFLIIISIISTVRYKIN